MDEKMLREGVRKYSTPAYFFDIDLVKENVSMFREVLGTEVSLCFAMKANSFLTKVMSEETDHIEVCSMGEFEICKRLKIAPEKLVISGVLKKTEDLEQILDYCQDACIYTAESIHQLKDLSAWCQKTGKCVKVYPRLTSGNQFGMDEEQIREIFRNPYKGITIQGIHYFSGTQKKKVTVFEKELTYLDAFLLSLEEEFGISIDTLEYGPGLAVSYFEGQEDKTRKELEAIAQMIKQMQWKGRVTLEMGRALSAVCGYYLTTVRDVKKNREKNYCVIDGGLHQLNYDGQIRGMYRPNLKLLQKTEGAGEEKQWTVCGSLCTVNDILVQKVNFPDLQIGDILVFERAGAYAVTEGMALFLSHELPKVVLYSKENGWKIIREEKQTYLLNTEEF